MIRVNENYTKLKASYLFSDIARRVAEFANNNPQRDIIRLGIGDVTRALPSVCIDAFHRGVDMIFYARRLRRSTFSLAVFRLTLMRYLLAMAPNAIRAIFRSCLPGI
jgi:hypothetical protein